MPVKGTVMCLFLMLMALIATASCSLGLPAGLPGTQPAATPHTDTVPTTAPPAADPLQFYLIIPQDEGRTGPAVGCGDSAAPAVAAAAPTGDAPTGDVTRDVRASLEALFAIRSEQVGQSGLVTALHDSGLAVHNVTLLDDLLLVDLAGTLVTSGVCADARMRAQILMTIFQYEGFDSAQVLVGSTNLKQIFDSSGLVTEGAVYTRDEAGL